jgi:hypothetical protein
MEQIVGAEMISDVDIFWHTFPFLSKNNSSRGNSYNPSTEGKAACGSIGHHPDLV